MESLSNSPHTFRPSKGSTLSAMFLVAGTCVGGGMLVLPLATGLNGFWPSIAMMVVCWAAMTATALLLLEASLWMEEGVHIITMTTRLLGHRAKVISWVLFLFISYATIMAYTAGAGAQIASTITHDFNLPLSKDLGALIFILIFGGIIYLGSEIVGRVNSIFFIAMIAAYIGLVGMGIDEVKAHNLVNFKWTGALGALPLLLTVFSFQTMVPSLTPYMKGHKNTLKAAIIGGTTIAFIIYAVWQWLILGIIPVEGSGGLAEALEKAQPSTIFLRDHVEGKWIAPIAESFAFFAIATSFFGMTLGLFDFLSDGLKIKKEGFGKVVLALLIIVPTMLFVVKFERIFLVALDTTGGYGDTILNGLLPVLMVWVGRYSKGYKDAICVPGGKPLLILIFCFFLGILMMEIIEHSSQLISIYQVNDVFKPQ